MRLLKRVNRLIGTLGIQPRNKRPLDFHLTQEDIETQLHYPRPTLAPESATLRVMWIEAATEH